MPVKRSIIEDAERMFGFTLAPLPGVKPKKPNGSAYHDGFGGRAAAREGVLDEAEAAGEPPDTADGGDSPEPAFMEFYSPFLAFLASRPVAEFDTMRRGVAKLLGIKLSTLEADVRRVRCDRGSTGGSISAGLHRGSASKSLPGRALAPLVPEPWPEPVHGSELCEALASFFTTYAQLPEGADCLLALWTLHTFCPEIWAYTPRLFVTAPTKRCGKSRVLRLLKLVCCKAQTASKISPAAVYRTIEMVHPTLLLDEMDEAIRNAPQLTQVLDGGYERGEGVIVSTGDDHEPRLFDLFAPVAMAGIGRLPGQLEDRSVRLSMRRALPGERKPKIVEATEERGRCLARQAARWIDDNREALTRAKPDVTHLPDRVDDTWLPLCAIASVVGAAWESLAKKAQAALAVRDSDTDSLAEQLIYDIRELIADDETSVSSLELTGRLVAIEGRSWAEMPKTGRPLTQNGLARLLRGFDIRPEKVGGADARVAGYLRQQFKEVFLRYPKHE